MDSTKVLQDKASKQVPEITTFTAAADVAGSLSGKMLNCTNAQGIACHYVYLVAGYTWAANVISAVLNPGASDKYFIVSIPAGETANNVATATRAVVNANSASADQTASGSTTAIIIANKRGGVAGVASTTDTGFTNTRTQTGTTTLTYDAGNSAGTNVKFQYFPPVSQAVNITALNLIISTGATTTAGVDMTKFGSITALTNGVKLSVMNSDGTTKKLITTFKNNYDLNNFATQYALITGAAAGAVEAYCDVVKNYGGTISVDGTKGEYLEALFVDATTGTGVINLGVSGTLVP